ncbi:hypothetical protein VNN36_03900 [Lactococcus garvieae]|uniref:hypothetical protein n=1 Tax=Lactococcus garvieae TaxID=1363 RepID=UPI0030D2B39E
MNREKVLNTIGVILGWLIIIAIFISSIFIIYHFLDILGWIGNILKPIGSLDAVIIVAIIGAIATFVVNIIAKRLDHKFESRKYLSEKRQVAYEDFLKIFFDILEANSNENIEERKDIPERLNIFKQTLLLYGIKVKIKIPTFARISMDTFASLRA